MDWVAYALIAVVGIVLFLLGAHVGYYGRTAEVFYRMNEMREHWKNCDANIYDAMRKLNDLEQEVKEIKDKVDEHREFSRWTYLTIDTNTKTLHRSITSQVSQILRIQRRTLFPARRRH